MIPLVSPAPGAACPQTGRGTRHFVDQWDGEPKSRAIHAFQVMAAGGARVDSQMIEGGRLEVRQLPLVLFAAPRAQHAAERPHREARPALQRTAGAVTTGRTVEDGELRRAAAERTAVLTSRGFAV